MFKFLKKKQGDPARSINSNVQTPPPKPTDPFKDPLFDNSLPQKGNIPPPPIPKSKQMTKDSVPEAISVPKPHNTSTKPGNDNNIKQNQPKKSVNSTNNVNAGHSPEKIEPKKADEHEVKEDSFKHSDDLNQNVQEPIKISQETKEPREDNAPASNPFASSPGNESNETLFDEPADKDAEKQAPKPSMNISMDEVLGFSKREEPELDVPKPETSINEEEAPSQSDIMVSSIMDEQADDQVKEEKEEPVVPQKKIEEVKDSSADEEQIPENELDLPDFEETDVQTPEPVFEAKAKVEEVPVEESGIPESFFIRAEEYRNIVLNLKDLNFQFGKSYQRLNDVVTVLDDQGDFYLKWCAVLDKLQENLMEADALIFEDKDMKVRL